MKYKTKIKIEDVARIVKDIKILTESNMLTE